MIAIIDYGIEKNNPLINFLTELKIDYKITYSESEILRADRIILPHTGSISSAVKQLHLLNLFTMLRLCNKPMLGISVGMHLMSAYSKEENLACLGIFRGTTEKFEDKTNGDSVSPLNEVLLVKESRLFKNIQSEEKFFFDNSHYLPVEQYTSAVAGHSPIFSAAIEKENFFGVQFLPEKSDKVGTKLLENFLFI
jgi:imidazole glycerol-phosphate synthase subunit HisH